MEKKNHWNTVYETKTPDQVSWTQDIPRPSLEMISALDLDKTAHIIDVGGGDSHLVDCLLDQGFTDITVLDISEIALERAKKRLGSRSKKVTWIACDIMDFEPERNYHLWHDRAAFHFLTTDAQKKQYKKTVSKAVMGYLVVGTFSEDGPQKCSGLEISQYSAEKLTKTFQGNFEKMTCFQQDHLTPFGTIQNFQFCCFQKKK